MRFASGFDGRSHGMGADDGAIALIEAVAGRDIQQRNIGPLADHVRGSLERAAASIAAHPSPSIAIITGFYLADGEPPNCETDGPPGAVMLGAGFASVGVPCRLATDAVNERVLRATAAAAACSDLAIDVVAMLGRDSLGGLPLDAVAASWRSASPPISHVIAIERCGPSRDGRPRNARGEDIGDWTAPLERLFVAGDWTTIGIGDLGNEVGMGSLPLDLVAASVPNGAALWCPVDCDHPIVCGVSNLGGAALLGALALKRPGWAERLLRHMSAEFAGRLLEAAVRDGAAVSSRPGGRPAPWLAVDGLPWDVLAAAVGAIHEACRDVVAGQGLLSSIPNSFGDGPLPGRSRSC